MERSEMRAGDADRQQVAERLRTAVDEGRLSLDEYDERLGSAYAAKTYGELDRLLADLPGDPVPVPQAPAVPRQASDPAPGGGRRPGVAPWIWAAWGGWLSVALINIGIWAMVSLGTGYPVTFWPIWVFGPWGIVLFMKSVGRGGCRRRYHRRW